MASRFNGAMRNTDSYSNRAMNNDASPNVPPAEPTSLHLSPKDCAQQFDLYASTTPFPERAHAYRHAAKFIREFCKAASPPVASDSELLDWLETQQGAALISDDDERWAVSYVGFQNVPHGKPIDVEATFLIAKDEWKSTIRDALRTAREKSKGSEGREV